MNAELKGSRARYLPRIEIHLGRGTLINAKLTDNNLAALSSAIRGRIGIVCLTGIFENLIHIRAADIISYTIMNAESIAIFEEDNALYEKESKEIYKEF